MSRLMAWWKRLQESLWFVPGLFTVAAVALSFGTLAVDRRHLREWDLPAWIFSAGAEGAQGVLSAIAGSLITVTGVVFSVTIVALQLASTQFTPRVLRNFTSDRVNQVVLGVFIGTFTYALLILRSVRLSLDDTEAFVPALSVVLAVLLALLSIGFLIFFIDHLARSIQVEVILERVASHAVAVAERLFPEEAVESGGAAAEAPSDEPGTLRAHRAGYLQAIDEEKLIEHAAERDLVVRVEAAVGDFLLVGAPLASVWPAAALDDRLADRVRDSVVIGTERTPHQDLGRGIMEISDIAVKALSPGINDPSTALVAVDRLSEVLLAVGRREPAPRACRGPDERVRLLVARPSFEEAVAEAFGPIAYYGAEHPRVLRRLLEGLSHLADLLPRDRRRALARQVEDVLSVAEQRLSGEAALAVVRAAGSRARTSCVP